MPAITPPLRLFLLPLLRHAAACLLLCLAGSAVAQDIASKFVAANGVRLHYLVAGRGAPIILLHGYGETAHMWRALMAELTKTHLVIAPKKRPPRWCRSW